MIKVTRELADYAARTRYEDLPIDVVDRTKLLILDTVGVMLAGSRTEQGKMITAFVKKIGERKECTIIGDGEKVSRFNAALANGFMAKVYGQDETYRFAGGGHVAAAFIPAAVVAADLESANGRQLIVSVVLGYDVFARALEGLGYSHRHRGFWSTQTLGTLAAAVATGKIYGLDSEQMKNAIGLATNLSAGLLEFVNDKGQTNVLELSCGWSCQNGLLASELAREGFVGPETSLEGKLGLFRAMGDQFFPMPWRVLENIGRDYWVMKAGFKPQSGCRHVHAAVDALLEVLKKRAIAPDDVEKIVVRTYSILTQENFFSENEPTSQHGAMGSIPYNLAMLFFHREGGYGPGHFDMFADPAVRALCKKVEIINDARLDRLYPQKMAARVEVVTKSGEKFIGSVDHPRGEPENPLTRDELLAKFGRLASTTISKDAIEEVISYIEHLEEVKNAREIIRLLYP